MSLDSLKIDLSTSLYGQFIYAKTVATRAQLVNNGFAADYMFDQLGDKNTRSGPTEYGDNFTLERRVHGRYKLLLTLSNEAQQPYGMGKVDPYKTDISGVLEALSCASGR